MVEKEDTPSKKEKKPLKKVAPKNPLKEYVLKKDIMTSKGLKKKGTKVKQSEEGYRLLRAKGIL